jgi:hypothetical protein
MEISINATGMRRSALRFQSRLEKSTLRAGLWPINLTSRESKKMHLIALILAMLVAQPAAAQSWKEYTYPTFTVAFPADPKIETISYRISDGRAFAARVYSVTQDHGVFTMTVADLTDSSIEEKAVVDHAIRTLSQGSEIKLNIPHRISQAYGRQLSVAGADGSYSFIAVFFHNRRLYQIEGRALPGSNATSDAIRFQQSLTFTENG